MKKILVPVDFSEFSENALKVAASIAKKNTAQIIAVHMMGLNLAQLTKEQPSDTESMLYLKFIQKRFEQFLDKDYLEGVSIYQTVKNDTVFNEINTLASELEADLIVMGSHGSSGLSEVFVGSNTEKVVRTATIPVLVVKASTVFDMRSGVFACDFKSENIQAFQKVTHFFNSMEIDIHLVYINTPGEHYLSTAEVDQRIVDFAIHLKDFQLIPEDVTVYNDYTVEKGIFNYAQKMKADLISLPTHGRRGLAHFFSGSIGEDIVNHSELPVLTMKI